MPYVICNIAYDICSGREMCSKDKEEEGVMNKFPGSKLIAVCLTLLMTLALAADAGVAGREYPSFLPANLYVQKDLRLLLEKMWMRSTTFRRQCERIGQTPGLVVSLRVTPRPGTIRPYRALTQVGKAEDGATIARVRIFNPSSMVELIGHELEHILEHLEGLDLRSPAVQKQLAAYRTADGFYETQRAIEAGRQVYSEYRDAHVPKHRAVASGTSVLYSELRINALNYPSTKKQEGVEK